MSPRSDSSTDTHHKGDAKEALLAAAVRLFTEAGYEAVSTRDIAEAAGVNLGAIQYHYGSKANLFVACIHSMMKQQAGGMCTTLERITDCGCKESAAVQLCRFIHLVMENQLRSTGPQPCRVMHREIFTDTAKDPEMYEALVSSVSTEYVKPMEEVLVSLLRHIKPTASSSELEFSAQSILGQCTHYLSKRPFLERLRLSDFSQSPLFEQTVEHIARFSLRALGCDEQLVERVIVSAGIPR